MKREKHGIYPRGRPDSSGSTCYVPGSNGFRILTNRENYVGCDLDDTRKGTMADKKFRGG